MRSLRSLRLKPGSTSRGDLFNRKERIDLLSDHQSSTETVVIPFCKICGVPSERMDVSGTVPRVCTLGWYAPPRWGA